MKRFPAVCLAAALCGCSEGDANDVWTVQVDSLPGGAVAVMNTPPAEERAPWTLPS